jgi:hypothetical protein
MHKNASLLAAIAATVAASAALAADEPVAASSDRATFDAEICKPDGLTAAQCDCAWTWLQGKMSTGDLKLAMLLVASNSENEDTVRKADDILNKHGSSDRRRDKVSSDFSSLVIDAEDACP